MNATFADIHAAADFIGPGAIEVPLYQTEIFDICRRSSPFGQRIKQVPATGHPSRFFEETAIPNPGTAGFVNPRSIVRTGGEPDARGAERAAEGDRLADQLQPVRHRTGRPAEAVCLSAGQGPGGHGERRDGGARRGAVERQRHQPERADDHAVHGRASAQIVGRRQHGDDRRPRRRSWTGSSRRWRRWWPAMAIMCGPRRSMPTRCCWT